MAADVLEEIIGLCLSIDSRAAEIYEELARCAENRALQNFWTKMSLEETDHVSYWKSLLDLSTKGMLPQVFDRPFEVEEDLVQIHKKMELLLNRSRTCPGLTNSFLLAFRTEFLLLHPAFEALFHLASVTAEEETVANHYEDHLNHFINALAIYGASTPELELIGEAIRHLWRDNRKLNVQSHTDSLSGLLNRRGLFQAILPLAHLAKRMSHNVGLLMVDLDHFKAINDTYGHQTGDEVICFVGKIISDTIRRSDIAGRYGGEEFLIYLSDVSENGLLVIAEKLRERVETEARSLEGVGVSTPITVSIGAAQGLVAEEPLSFIERLIRRADHALYNAKRLGRNRVETDG